MAALVVPANDVCSVPQVRNPLPRLALVALGGLCLVATSCSSQAETVTPTDPSENDVQHRPLHAGIANNRGDRAERKHAPPTALTQGATTQCAYRAESVPDGTVIIRYDTDTTVSSFVKYRSVFERHGLRLGPITDLGDQGYYFTEQVGHNTVSTVVLLEGSLQLLVTGTAALNPIGSIRASLWESGRPSTQRLRLLGDIDERRVSNPDKVRLAESTRF